MGTFPAPMSPRALTCKPCFTSVVTIIFHYNLKCKRNLGLQMQLVLQVKSNLTKEIQEERLYKDDR